MFVHGPSTGLLSNYRAHGPTIHRILERLVRAQSRRMSAVNRTVPGRRDWRLQVNARAEDRLARSGAK